MFLGSLHWFSIDQDTCRIILPEDLKINVEDRMSSLVGQSIQEMDAENHDNNALKRHYNQGK